jgi:hypothetical protein
MAQEIPKNQFGYGAGKGDDERPVNRKVFRENISKIKKHGMRGTLLQKKGSRSTFIYR